MELRKPVGTCPVLPSVPGSVIEHELIAVEQGPEDVLVEGDIVRHGAGDEGEVPLAGLGAAFGSSGGGAGRG